MSVTNPVGIASTFAAGTPKVVLKTFPSGRASTVGFGTPRSVRSSALNTTAVLTVDPAKASATAPVDAGKSLSTAPIG